MNRRDIELLISAKETTGRSFSAVTSNIDALNAKIEQQISAAERGELSLADLKKSQQELAQAGRDLSQLQGQIDAYGRLAANQDKAAESAASAVQDWLNLKAQIDSAGKATDAQTARLGKLETRIATTSAAVEKNSTDMAAQAAVLERAGVSTTQLETAQTGLVNAARQVGAGLTQAGTAVDGFAVNLQRARDAEQDLAAQQGFERKIAEAQRLGDASRFVNLFASAINTVKTADNQLAALSGFRAVGAMASEAANDISRFATAGDAMAVSSRNVAAGLRAIIDPGGAALATLGGVEAAIREADAAAAEGVKNVNILNTAYNNLSEASASLLRQGALVDTFQQQANAVGLASAQMEQAQADVIRLGQAMAQAEVPTEQLSNELAQAEARLQTTGRALAQEEAKLATLSRELKTAGINTADLANETKRLEGAATTAGTAMGRIATVTGRGGAATNGIFGLKPQDLTNVGYQLNDIFVSLASGQKPLTVFIQQGAQLAQIPGLLSGVAGAIARFFPLIAIVGGVVTVVGSMVAQAAQIEEFTKALEKLNVATTGLTGEGLSKVSTDLQRLGVTAEDAKQAILDFAEEGLSLDQISAYTEAAAEAAKVIGIDFNDAVKMQQEVLTGGMDAVIALTESTHTLTDADLDHIQALFDDGKAAEARDFALNKNKETLDIMARNSQSIWTPAVNDLKSAWGSFVGYLNSWVQPAISKINQIMRDAAVGVTYLTGLLTGLDSNAAAARAVAVTAPRAAVPNGANNQSLRDRQYKSSLEEEYKDSKLLTAEERRRNAQVDARRKAQKAGVSTTVQDLAATKALAKINEEIRKEEEASAKKGAAASKRAQSARDKAAREAETEANKRLAAQKTLTQQLRQLDRAAGSGDSATLDQRLEAINTKYEQIYDSINKVKSLGLGTAADGRSLADVEKQIEAQKQRLKDEETIKFYQEQAALLDKQRSAEIQRVTDAQTRGALSVKEATEQAAEINARLSPQIVKAAQSALAVAKSIAGATPSPEMVSWIASLERIINGEGTNDIVAKVGLGGLDEQSTKLNDLLRQRDDLVNAYATLGQLGVSTAGQTRDAMKQAFATTALDIQPVLIGLRQTVETLHNTKDALTGLPLLTDTAYASWLAKIAAVNAGLSQTTTHLSELENQTFQNIATGAVNAFTAAAEGIAGIINGTQSFGDVVENIGRSIIQTFADITAAIAQAIIKFLILSALEAAAGLPPGTLSGGGGKGPSLFGLFHSGGTVGGGTGRKRRDNASNWVGAPKFHNGGGMGLENDEYRAILKRGEEVLTDDDPRHINNGGGLGGGGGAAAPSIKQVLVLDPAEIANVSTGRAGQQAFMTNIRTMKETIKQVLK